MYSLLAIWRLTRSTAVRVAFCVLVLATGAAQTWAQGTDLFVKVGTLIKNDGTPVVGPVAIDKDTAVVGSDGIVYVFTRTPGADDFQETATLTASDGGAGFGKSVALDGDTAAVGADGAAYVFRRAPDGHTWQEVARLTGDVNTFSFGGSLDVSGGTIVVGALPNFAALEIGRGLVYVFEEDAGGKDAWGEVARLMATWNIRADTFGSSLSIDGNTIVVGAVSLPTFPAPSLGQALHAWVFSRAEGGADPWPLASTFQVDWAGDGGGYIRHSGDTIVGATVGPVDNRVRLFQQERGEPNTWDEAAFLVFGQVPNASISGNLVALGTARLQLLGNVLVYARHEGARDGWGEVASIRPVAQPPVNSSARVSISGDTLLLGNTMLSETERTPFDVYVVDTDRDGLRDAIDPCPRDPLNNAAGGCHRAIFAHIVVDDLLTLDDVTSVTQGDEFIITANFTNSGETAVRNPFFEVTELTGGNQLVNSDAGLGGVGATLSPDVGDGILSPGESMTADFVVRLATREPFQFRVSVRGDTNP